MQSGAIDCKRERAASGADLEAEGGEEVEEIGGTVGEE